MYKMCWILVVFVVLGCDPVTENSNEPSVDSAALKLQELLLYNDLSVLQSEAEKGEIPLSAVLFNQGVNEKYEKLKASRAKISDNDRLRELNVIDYLKSRMNDPFSFILHDISFRSDAAPYSSFGYKIANVEYFGNNSYGARVRERAKLRITPHGFVMQKMR